MNVLLIVSLFHFGSFAVATALWLAAAITHNHELGNRLSRVSVVSGAACVATSIVNYEVRDDASLWLIGGTVVAIMVVCIVGVVVYMARHPEDTKQAPR